MKNAAKSFGFTLVANVHTIAAFEAAEGDERRGRGLRSAPSLIPDGVLSGSQLEKFAMISKFTTHQKAEIWVNLDQIIQIATLNTVQDGYPSTEIIMANGVAINVYEKPVDIANVTKGR
jgi:hypothetical protein